MATSQEQRRQVKSDHSTRETDDTLLLKRFKPNLQRAMCEVDIHIHTSKLCINCCILHPVLWCLVINRFFSPTFTVYLRHKDTCMLRELYSVVSQLKMAQTV